MAEIDRPGWCPHEDCGSLTSYDGRICFGRLPHKLPHDDLFNTHRRCEDGEEIVFNAEDAILYIHGFQLAIKDCEDNGLYMPPGRGETWDLRKN